MKFKSVVKLLLGLALSGFMSLAAAGTIFTATCSLLGLAIDETATCQLDNTWSGGPAVESATLTVSHSFLDNTPGADYFLNGNFVSGNTTECNSFACPDATETPESFDVTAIVQAALGNPVLFTVVMHDFAPDCNVDFCDGASFDVTLTVTVPEPTTIALFGLGLAGLGFRLRKRA